MISNLSNLSVQALLALLLVGGIGCTSDVSQDAAPASEPISISAPTGLYKRDPTHATLQFTISHLGLSNYIAGFTDYEVSLQLDSGNVAASSVTVTINPSSIRTDYHADYKASHPESAFSSWEEDLAMSDKFFNAAQHPEIRFQSTSVQEQPIGTLQIAGDLTLLGQTHPIVLSGKVVGSAEQHPFTSQPAVGLSVSGAFKRSTFGMNYLLSPPLVGDEVKISFEGEMHHAP